MKLYRALKPLDAGGRGLIPRGKATPLDWLNDEQIARLEHVGAASEIHAPPLSQMPLPKSALAKMKKAGLEDAGDLLMGNDAELAKKLRVQKATAAKWRNEVARLLMVEPPVSG